MKTSWVVVLALASLASSAAAQDQAGSGSKSSAQAASALSSKPLVVLGKVGADGRTLLTDIDSEWNITNPEALKGHEGRRVSVKCYVDTDKNRLQVLRVKKEDGESRYSVNYNDSAFRR